MDMEYKEFKEHVQSLFSHIVNQPEKIDGTLNVLLRELESFQYHWDQELYEEMIYNQKEKILKQLTNKDKE
jgi:hypothetical protein